MDAAQEMPGIIARPRSGMAARRRLAELTGGTHS